VLSSSAIEGGKIAMPPRGGIIVGSADKADIMVDNANVSGLHARLEVNGDGELQVTDLDSTNGSAIKSGFLGLSQTRLQSGVSAELKAGSTLVLAKVAISASFVPVDESVPVARKAKAGGFNLADIFANFFGGTQKAGKAAKAAPAAQLKKKPAFSFGTQKMKAEP
jgi:hypothetical protein